MGRTLTFATISIRTIGRRLWRSCLGIDEAMTGGSDGRVGRVIVQGLSAVQPRTHELWIVRRILDGHRVIHSQRSSGAIKAGPS
jgi:hypothetical protein